ncbi:hypothetical protein HFO49_36465 [Rhizobium leguminosarum]|uniref:hypothetical protein n=1 Tax=Rhizobium leguminosarum TaxID=384 RepID=UPI001030F086|nr:hypothetical protein [Rhizobium leguminosarum]MBY5592820.1 hypothetical protein [Rhizobium leguminosarum]TAY14772.1 hypothetical protein ELH96_24835 [Rhizobium leguminosarum]
MGKLDKDRFQKELGIQYCLAKGMMPFLEVIVQNTTDLTDTTETLTDLDVLGVGLKGDGVLFKTIIDCKSGNKMSAMNRAFWAAGVREYVSADDAVIILKNTPVRSHRLSALSLGVDLHDETSFQDLGRVYDLGFPTKKHYQSSLEGWEKVFDAYATSGWAAPLSLLVQAVAPVTLEPSTTFRKVLAELRAIKGNFDPNKPSHVAILLDCVASVMVLWSTMARDIRRFYDPKMDRTLFEHTLRYYLWGGKEAYTIRQQLSEKLPGMERPRAVELPQWDLLVQFAGVIVAAPNSAINSAFLAKEAAIKALVPADPVSDASVNKRLEADKNARTLCKLVLKYLVLSCQLPREFLAATDKIIDSF